MFARFTIAQGESDTLPAMNRQQQWAVALLAYTTAVHAIDCLATQAAVFPWDWTIFQWQAQGGFDAFKFFAWLVVPALLALRTLDPGWFGLRRWHRADAWILLALCVMGAGAVAAVAWVPGLRDMYPSMRGYPAEIRWEFASYAALWLVSWLVGWEFLHRYLLAKALAEAFPRRPLAAACLVIPPIEAIYHLAQGKDYLESAAVLVFATLLTAYAVHRRNALLPFLAHLFIEVALIAFLLLV